MNILTLTVNPAIDKSSTSPKIVPTSKLRCTAPVYEPGGGGINVARAMKKIGGDAKALYLAGGPGKPLMDQLLEKEGIRHEAIEIQGWIRENFVVVDTSTNNQYRFGMPGPEVSAAECQACLDYIDRIGNDLDILVISGSLSPGIPEDFVGQVAKKAKGKGIKVVVDTSGSPLLKAVEEGVFLIKPNLNELAQLSGKERIGANQQEKFAMQLVENGKASLVAVSLGPRGAMLASKEGIEYVVPPTVFTRSTVGAGDSMVGGMVYALSLGKSHKEMIRYGVASGTAATMNPGTALCKKEDVEEIFAWLMEEH